MKGDAVIEAAAKTTRVAFDKTGTLTVGRPIVTDVVPLGADVAGLLAVAAGVETGSGNRWPQPSCAGPKPTRLPPWLQPTPGRSSAMG